MERRRRGRKAEGRSGISLSFPAAVKTCPLLSKQPSANQDPEPRAPGLAPATPAAPAGDWRPGLCNAGNYFCGPGIGTMAPGLISLLLLSLENLLEGLCASPLGDSGLLINWTVNRLPETALYNPLIPRGF